MQSLISNLDFFITVPPIQSLETLTFFQLPIPQVSPYPPPISTVSDLLFLCHGSAFEVPLRIDKFPVETALSKFIADVSPRDIDLCVDDFEVDEARLSKEAPILNEEKDVGGQRTAAEIEKSKGQVVNDYITERSKFVQFETPALREFEENALFFEEESIQILSKASEIEGNLEMLEPRLATQHSCGVLESFLSVDDITFEYPREEKVKSEDDCSSQDHFQLNQLGFPTLEVDETVLETVAGFSAEEKLLTYFETIELPDAGKDHLDSEDKEIWVRREYSISELDADHFLSGHSIESDYGSQDNFPEVDLIGLVEISQIVMKSVVQGTSDGDCFLSDQPVVFHEFHILDVDSAQDFEAIFNTQPTYELDTCSGMFNEGTTFKNFDNLIVSHELTLVDDTFKSFPIPVIRDRVKLRSFCAIVEEKFASLKLHPMSALDEIYLDWHLLEEDKHNCHTYYYQNILGDMLEHSIEHWDFVGDSNVLYEFVLSDESVNELNKKENMESKEFLSGLSISTDITGEVKLSGKSPQADSGEQLASKNSARASLLFQSMSRSNDLDFFLNAQKVPLGINGESSTEAVSNKTESFKAPLGSSVPGVPQAGQSITVDNDRPKLFDDLPVEEIYVEEIYDMRARSSMGKVESHSIALPIPSMPFANEPKHLNVNLESLPETVILVNTQNLDKEMIVSRRSTYQKILAIEKTGAQVVERDSDLPVDIIINSATCLVWYDSSNIGKKASSLDEASSSLPLCIENIATNILTLLSFNFSGCIMVFEGENSFLSTVMEFSDELYAAAASLGIDVQLFCSYSSESTDEIIISSIQYAIKGAYPRMSESESLAESFLTKFPSVNPLTAHAILSSGGMLSEFLEWSNERRVHAVKKYHVPHESIALLIALCKYGEREDSRSIMTDCSSSVSSGTDSQSFNLNTASKRKRWTSDGSLDKSGTHTDDSLRFNPVKQLSKDTSNPSLVQKPHDTFPKGPETSHEFRNLRLHGSNLFHAEPDLDATLTINPSGIPKGHDFQTSNEPQMFKKISKLEFSFGEELSGQQKGADEAILKKIDPHDMKGSWIPFEDQKGEVIDLTGSPRSRKGFSSIDDSISFLMPEIENDARGKSKAARRLSFGKNHQTIFPTSAEIFSEKNTWKSVKDQGHLFEVGSNSYLDIDLGDNVSTKKHPNQLLEDSCQQRPTESSHGLEFLEKEPLHFGGTLKSALSFSSPGRKSPWTTEFLNKIRDKSRLRHQSLPCDTSTTFGLPGNISKDFKRRSPSILEFFKYQGGNTKRVPEQKKQKRSMQSGGSSKANKPSASAPIRSTWTPLDKRARQTLSFTMNSGERQTKLVWNDGTPDRSNKFQNQI